MTIYVYGCSTCGINGIYIRKVKSYAKEIGEEVQIKNSKYSNEVRMEHAEYLKSEGLDADTYQPIVVEGNEVTRLREFEC